jgi:tetratricopeptide (TPR) repeat protein
MSKKPFSAAIIYVVLGLVFIATISIRTISTPQIWTHLAQGRSNAPISYVESATAVNTTHLYDKMLYGLWNAGGASALIIVNVIALLAALILLLQVSKTWGGPLSQGFALLISGQLIFYGFDVDPKTFMMLFIALYVYVLTTARNPVILFGSLIPLQILWTNMHDSFVFGPLLAFVAAIQASRIQHRKKQQGLDVRTLGILTAALFAATLFNPYFLKIYGQVTANFKYSNLTWGSNFREYFPASSHHPVVFFVLILGASGLITLKRKLPIMLTTLAIIGAFLIIRPPYAAQLFVALAFPFLVLSFTAVGESLTESFRTLLGKQANLLRPATQIVFVLLVILSLWPVVSSCAYARLGSASTFGLGIEEDLYPSGAAALIQDPAFPDKALNLPADGGYLAFKYDRKVFVDSRPARYDRDLLLLLSDMMKGNAAAAAAADSLYETHRPEAVIINTLAPSSANGLKTLLLRGIWKLAYFDGVTAVLLLDKEEFAPLLNNGEVQAAGLARLEAARAAYAANVDKGCRAGNPAALMGSGPVFLAFNRPVEAKAAFTLLLQGNNELSRAWIGLGSSQLMLKEFDAAVVSLETATRLAPRNWYAWYRYAQACELAGQTAEKEKALERMKSIAAKVAKAAKAAEETDVKEVPVENASSKPAALDLTVPE